MDILLRQSRKAVGLALFGSFLVSAPAFADPNKDVILNGLLGAGVGAISAEASGGKAGKGALIGAGVSVIGGALLNLFAPQTSNAHAYSQPAYSQPTYQQPVYVQQPQYQQYQYVQQPQYQQYQYVQQQPQVIYTQSYYSRPVRREVMNYQPTSNYGYVSDNQTYDPNRRIIRNGLLGAGVGAISAEASGGKAGTGALVGAGSNVIGDALLNIFAS